MSGNIQIKIDAYDFAISLSRLEENLIINSAKIIKRWNLEILNESIKKVPVDRGQLQTSLTEVVTTFGKSVVGRVGSNKFYAPYVHGVLIDGKWVGPRPHFVPFSVAPDLIKWVTRHNYAQVINGELYKMDKKGKLKKIHGLYVKGTPRPFIGNAYDKYKNDILEDFNNIMRV